MRALGLVKALLYTYSLSAYMEITMLKRTLGQSFPGRYLSGRSLSAWYFAVFATIMLVGGMNSSVWAQDMDDESGDSADDESADSDAPMAAEVPDDPDAVKHGIGIRLRYVFVPQGLIEIFMEEAAGGMTNPGFGLEYVRRKKDVEITIGFEYDKLSGTEGFYIENGGSTQKAGTVDFIEFDKLAWFSIDFSYIKHYALSSMVSLRYGGGIGLGFTTGEVIKTDANCGGTTTASCSPDLNPGGDLNEKQDFFRFPPVFNLTGGVQVTPVRNVAINFEIGMRTIFYTGVTGQYFF